MKLGQLMQAFLKLANGNHHILHILDHFWVVLNYSTSMVDWNPPVSWILHIELISITLEKKTFLFRIFNHHLGFPGIFGDIDHDYIVRQQAVSQDGLLQRQWIFSWLNQAVEHHGNLGDVWQGGHLIPPSFHHTGNKKSQKESQDPGTFHVHFGILCHFHLEGFPIRCWIDAILGKKIFRHRCRTHTSILEGEKVDAEDGVVEDEKGCHWSPNSSITPKYSWIKQSFQDVVRMFFHFHWLNTETNW